MSFRPGLPGVSRSCSCTASRTSGSAGDGRSVRSLPPDIGSSFPTKRGYNTSDKPEGIREYTLPKLLGDVVALADALGIGRFHLVGHDWGGIVAWAAGAKLTHRLDKLVILNAPHPEVLFTHALRSPTQFLRSSYAVFFQIPLLPEAVLGARRSALLARALRTSSRDGRAVILARAVDDPAFSDEVLEQTRAWIYAGLDQQSAS
ncbi:alpha/beta fold hydrolase [Mesorhizobium sp. M0700]|uniref:alpha/beta fold hydrolase n=1 Tax=unclassified Mesorhizobium TaxID=325217 RepID=UPI0033357983